MRSGIKTPFLQSDVTIILDGVKTVLAKFPRIRNPVARSRFFGRNPDLITGAISIKPKIYYRASNSYAHELTGLKAKRVKRELLDAGVTIYGLLKSESRFLRKILHDNEHIEAAIYGQHNSSSAMMVATNERILYLDKKPMVTLFDEVSYEVVSGIEFDIHKFFATVVLHTPVRNYEFKYVNLHCAETFARHIEKHRLEHEPRQDNVIEVPPSQPRLPVNAYPDELNDLAGYYWLPADEEERRKIQQINV